MKRILAIILVVILVLSSFTFAFANNGNGNGNVNESEQKNTWIHVKINGDKEFVSEVWISYDGNEIKLDKNNDQSSSGLYTKLDNGGYVSDKITQIKVILNNGDEVIDNDPSGTEANGTINYRLTVSAPQPEEYTLTINYVDEEGKPVADIYIETLEDGDDYSVDSPEVIGYTPNQATVSGTITGDTEVTVTYTINPKYTVSLNVSPIHGGTVSGAGEYEVGDTVTITASTNLGYTFEGWIENTNIADGDQTDSSFTFTMPEGNVEYTANFKGIIAPPPLQPLEFYELTLVSNPVGAGLLTGGGTYPATHPVPISATPESGFNFINWTNEGGDEVSDIAGFVYTMPASDVTLTANFEADDTSTDPVEFTLTINYVDEDGDTIADIHTETLSDGSDYNVPSPVIDGYTPDQAAVSGTITQDTTETVVYTAEDTTPVEDPTYSVLLTASPAKGGSVAGFGTYSEDDPVTITATPKDGYEFKEWTLEGNTESTKSTHNFTMPAQNLTLTAVFEKESSGGGGGTTNPPSSTNTYEMSIEKTALQDEVNLGEDADFEIVVTNEGNTRLTNITVKDDMTGLNETINLNEGQSRTFKVSVTTTVKGSLTNTAEALHDIASFKQDTATVNVIETIEVNEEETPQSKPKTKNDEPEDKPEEVVIEDTEQEIPKDIPETKEPEEEPKEEPETEEIYDETVPLDLPDTGVLPIELFFGLGALVSGAGVLVSKKK